jgi:hypothetical protein
VHRCVVRAVQRLMYMRRAGLDPSTAG